MEQVFADTFKAMIDYWMTMPQMGTYINFIAVLELAAQAFVLVMWGNTAPLNEKED
ncbi:MAG: hypothetical protein WCK70_12495 [Chloroflexales bacterium]|jgi:hypothetical protein